ncbi:MAG: hypothetical protein V7K81_20490 [Nostoc sp.]
MNISSLSDIDNIFANFANQYVFYPDSDAHVAIAAGFLCPY